MMMMMMWLRIQFKCIVATVQLLWQLVASAEAGAVMEIRKAKVAFMIGPGPIFRKHLPFWYRIYLRFFNLALEDARENAKAKT